MRQPYRAFILAGLVVAAGCSDQSSLPTAPSSPNLAGTLSLDVAPQPRGVGAVGVVDQVNAQDRTLVLLQTGLEFRPGEQATVTRHELAVGALNQRLHVVATPDARVYLNAEEKSFEDLKPGTEIIVVGRLVGEGVEATTITDLTPVEPPPGMREMLRARPAKVISPGQPPSLAAAEGVSLCYAQDVDFADPDVLEFHGCWGGPSAGGTLNVGVPFFWVVVGWLEIDYFSYLAGLSGYSFAWPFRFTAAPSSPLVYHVPREVALGVEGLEAPGGTLTFLGGFGLDFGVNVDFCPYVGSCSDLDTFHAGIGQTYESNGAPPTDTTMTLNIEEPTCMSAGIFPIKGFSPLSVSYCWDLKLEGDPFKANVRAIGSGPVAADSFGFQKGTSPLSVRPNATAVTIRFDNMRWEPNHVIGGYFTFNVFDWEAWRTPNIFNTSHGGLKFVDPEFPPPLGMTLATKRSTGEQLEQPKFIEFTFPVAPAPTRLRFPTDKVLVERNPVTVRLSEQYDDAAIPGQTITIQATGVGTAPSVAASLTTDDEGTTSLLLPPGEYQISAQFAGTATYEPSSAATASFFVYRPTTFVIWGGNAGGIVTDATVQFWGTGWSRQVLNGSYGGNASFKGFAIPLGDDMWAAAPGSSGKEPVTIPHLIAVIVTTHVQGRGANTIGNVAGFALLRVDDPAAYQPNSGHPATGVVRGMLQ